MLAAAAAGIGLVLTGPFLVADLLASGALVPSRERTARALMRRHSPVISDGFRRVGHRRIGSMWRQFTVIRGTPIINVTRF